MSIRSKRTKRQFDASNAQKCYKSLFHFLTPSSSCIFCRIYEPIRKYPTPYSVDYVTEQIKMKRAKKNLKQITYRQAYKKFFFALAENSSKSIFHKRFAFAYCLCSTTANRLPHPFPPTIFLLYYVDISQVLFFFFAFTRSSLVLLPQVRSLHFIYYTHLYAACVHIKFLYFFFRMCVYCSSVIIVNIEYIQAHHSARPYIHMWKA